MVNLLRVRWVWGIALGHRDFGAVAGAGSSVALGS